MVIKIISYDKGSTVVYWGCGRFRVMEAAAKAGPTDVHLELGGKSAMIVFDDVEDVRATVDWICVGVFSNTGQVCRWAGSFSVANKYFLQLTSYTVR